MLGQAADGRRRVVIEQVSPEIDCGRFAIKRVLGETVVVEADVFADGHDQVTCQILYSEDGENFQSSPMQPLANDRWRGEFTVAKLGQYQYTVEGWIDHFQTWRHALEKRIAADQDVHVDLLIGVELIEAAAVRAAAQQDATLLRQWAHRLRENKDKPSGGKLALDEELLRVMERNPDRTFSSRYEKQLTVVVDRVKARFSTWYELFPRSCSSEPGRHGTFCDCEAWLPYVASMGFDVVYLPPIHPIGHTFRKGKNNSVVAQPVTLAVLGPSDRRKAVTQSIHPNSEHWKILSGSARRLLSTDLKSRSILPFNARQTIRMRGSIRNGSASDRTARYNMRRIRPRSIKISTHSISKVPNGGRCGRN